jgi:predicted 3-demethylubiquinone-9 3-methyltransferase (glyoxalase superfamily)
MQKITPFLWFDHQAEEAAKFYTSIFKNSKRGAISRYEDDESSQRTGRPKGSVMVIEFTIDGQDFIALNGGPMFKFNESVSFVINCTNQEDVDYYWNKLTADGGQESMCGWLKDKFGLSWQVVPRAVTEMLQDKNRVKANRVMQELLTMKKIDIAKLKKAYDRK